ncbi:MAG: hypothetical protein IAF02_20065 [Anaerolineae bacterium]|nr:hypothetical protein [Anaerolineae bacterium]
MASTTPTTATTTAKPENLYKVGKTIKYKNPDHPLYNQVIEPGTKQYDLASAYPKLEPKQLLALKQFDPETKELLLPFPHLNANDMQVLLTTKTLIPA